MARNNRLPHPRRPTSNNERFVQFDFPNNPEIHQKNNTDYHRFVFHRYTALEISILLYLVIFLFNKTLTSRTIIIDIEPSLPE